MTIEYRAPFIDEPEENEGAERATFTARKLTGYERKSGPKPWTGPIAFIIATASLMLAGATFPAAVFSTIAGLIVLRIVIPKRADKENEVKQ